MSKELVVNPTPQQLVINPTFEPLFYDFVGQKRYTQLYGGRSSGKSFAASIAMVKRTYSKFKHKILYLRQTMASMEDSSKSDIEAAIEFLGVEKDFKYKAGLFTNKKTKATISFKGIKSNSGGAKLKSLSGVTTLVIEEAEEVESWSEFFKVDASLRTKGKPVMIVLIYNPGTSIGSWIHTRWFADGQPCPKSMHNTLYLHSTYLDNLDNMDEGTIQMFNDLKLRDITEYRNTVLAEWTLDAAGRIYLGWGSYPNFYDEGDVWYGLDFSYGGKDKTACVKINYFEGVYYVSQMFSIDAKTIGACRTALLQAGVPFNAKIFCDSAMPLLITELQRSGFTGARKCKKGNVDSEIIKVKSKHIVYVGDEKDELWNGYMTWRRDKSGKKPHEPDELAAMRYGINSKKPSDKPKKNPLRAAKPVFTPHKKGFL